MEIGKELHSEPLLHNKLIKPKSKLQPSTTSQSIKKDFSDLSSQVLKLSPSFIRTPFRGTCLEVSSSGNLFIFGSREGRIGIYDKVKNEIIKEKDLEEGSVWTLDITSDEKFIYAGGQGGKIKKYSIPDLVESKGESLPGHASGVNKLVLSKSNDFLFSAGDDGLVKKWNIKSLEETVLYKHEYSVLGLDVSNDSELIATCDTNGSVKVVNIRKDPLDSGSKPPKKLTKENKDLSLTCIKISPNKKFVIAGGSVKTVFVWKLDDWDSEKVLHGHYDRINCLDISSDDRTLVTGSSDNLIKVWDLTFDKEEITLHGHSDWIKGVALRGEEVHSMSDDFTIMSTKIPVFSSQKVMQYEEKFENPESFVSSGDLYVVNNRICKLNNALGLVYENEKFDKTIIGVKLVKKESVLVIFLRDEKSTKVSVTVKDLVNHGHQGFILNTSSNVNAVEADEEGKYFITGESFRVTIWNSQNAEDVHVLRSHTSDVTALAMSENYLFAGDQNGVIKIYNFNLGYYEMSQLSIGKAAILRINVSKDRRFLIASTSSNQVYIWSTQAKSCLKEIQLRSPVTQLLITKDDNHFLFSHDSKLEIWNMDNFSKCSEIVNKNFVNSFALHDNDRQIVYVHNEYLKVAENPIYSSTFSIHGHHDMASKFVSYIQKIIKGEIPKYDDSMNKWLIEPYHINILHLYAFYNLDKHLAKAIKSGAPFILSRSGYTALSICVEKKLQDCIDTIFETFKNQAEENPFVFYYFSNTLAALNRSSYPKLHQFYEMVYRKSIALSLPKFCESSVSLPIRKYSTDLFIDKGKFMSSQKYSSKDVAIEFYQSFVSLPSQMGSSESLDFLRSLIDCKNIEVFSSSLLKRVLEEKWKRARYVFLAEGVLYYIYLVSLCLYTIKTEWRDRYELVAPMAVNVILLINEIIQMAYSRGKYFTSFWNYIDLTRFLLFTTYFVLIFLELQPYYLFPQESGTEIWEIPDSVVKSKLLLACVFFSLIRGGSYFRINSTTRWVVNLIFEVFYQLWALMLVTLYAMLSFIVVYNYYSEKGFSDFLTQNHDVAEYEYFLMFVVLVINPIIMLNLFIAIVGETFEKSQDSKSVKNGQDLAEMIFEAELLFLCNRKLKNLKFIHEVREEYGELVVQQTAGQRIKKISQGVLVLNENTLKNREEVANLKKIVEEGIWKIKENTILIMNIAKNNGKRN